MGSRCQVFSKYRMCVCADMQHCTCVCMRVWRYMVHVYVSRLCTWFRITVSRNSRFESVNRPAGASLTQCTNVLWVHACRLRVCALLSWYVTQCAGTRRGAHSSVRSLPRWQHEAARPKKAQAGPGHWPLPATLAGKKWRRVGRFSPSGPPKLG